LIADRRIAQNLIDRRAKVSGKFGPFLIVDEVAVKAMGVLVEAAGIRLRQFMAK
jgi:exopolysaccharide biosynthesis protein